MLFFTLSNKLFDLFKCFTFLPHSQSTLFIYLLTHYNSYYLYLSFATTSITPKQNLKNFLKESNSSLRELLIIQKNVTKKQFWSQLVKNRAYGWQRNNFTDSSKSFFYTNYVWLFLMTYFPRFYLQLLQTCKKPKNLKIQNYFYNWMFNIYLTLSNQTTQTCICLNTNVNSCRR